MATQRYKRLEPLILQGNAEVDREGEIETKSQSHSEDNREEDKGKRNGEGVHTENVVEATSLGLRTKSGLRPYSTI